MSSSAIKQLPPAAAAQITSSALLTTLNEVIIGLVTNSLDARAKKLRIHVDYACGNCTLEDDGMGIPRAEFEVGGGLVKKNHTSKHLTPQTHGYKGLFLSSLSTLCLLSITSHHPSSPTSNTLTVLNGAVIAQCTPSHSDEPFLLFSHGTRVTVRDLFGNMPVRVRQRSSEVPERMWIALLWTVASLLVAWPDGVTVTMSEGTTGNKKREMKMRALNERKLPQKVPRVLSQAQLRALGNEKWEEVSAAAGDWVVKGCICRTPAASRKSQFISLGVVPVANDGGTRALYDEVNKIFATSDFANGVDDAGEDKWKIGPRRDVNKRTKKLEKWPMFYFQVLLPKDVGRPERVLDSPGSLVIVSDLLRAICTEFLKKTGYSISDRTSYFLRDHRSAPSLTSLFSTRPVPVRSVPVRSVPARSVSTSSRPRPASPFDSWSLIKVGHAQRPAIKPNAFPQLLLVYNSGKLTRPPFDVTKPEVKPTATKTMKDVVATWENPEFECGQPLIPQLKDVSSLSASERPPARGSGVKNGLVSFETLAVGGKSRLSKEALQKARVLQQVDQKFILISLPRDIGKKDEGRLLVVVDQHAADERAQLEGLMKGYFDERGRAVSEVVESTLKFEVLGEEGELLARYKKHFQNWGIWYDITDTLDPPSGSTITITTLPPAIHTRCTQDPSLLITLLRAEIWHLADSAITTTTIPTLPPLSSSPHSFIPRFRNCPAGILDLLNSRACRSAVMFNDELGREEAERLVEGVKECAFPFQCAHGRPAMVPVVEMGGGRGFWEGDVGYENGSEGDVWRVYLQDVVTEETDGKSIE